MPEKSHTSFFSLHRRVLHKGDLAIWAIGFLLWLGAVFLGRLSFRFFSSNYFDWALSFLLIVLCRLNTARTLRSWMRQSGEGISWACAFRITAWVSQFNRYPVGLTSKTSQIVGSYIRVNNWVLLFSALLLSQMIRSLSLPRMLLVWHALLFAGLYFIPRIVRKDYGAILRHAWSTQWANALLFCTVVAKMFRFSDDNPYLYGAGYLFFYALSSLIGFWPRGLGLIDFIPGFWAIRAVMFLADLLMFSIGKKTVSQPED